MSEWSIISEFKNPIEYYTKFPKFCRVCGRSIPKVEKHTIYCCGECEFHMKNRLGCFMIGDHPELVERRIYTI